MLSAARTSLRLYQAILLLSALCFSINAQANPATLSDTHEPLLQLTFMTDEDKQGRVFLNPAGPSRIEVDKHNAYYLLFDPDAPDFWMVDMGRQHITYAHDLMFTGSGGGLYYLNELGPGEDIAGMDTRVFEIQHANGSSCAHYHVAPQALALEPQLAPLQSLINQLAINPSRVVPALGPLAAGFISPCLRAEFNALPELAKIGLPLKRINKDDEVAFVVTDIAPTSQVDPCRLALPDHYEPRTPAEVALESLKDALLRRNKPDTDDISLQDCP